MLFRSETEMRRARAIAESEALAERTDVEEIADTIGMYATLLDDPGQVNRDLAATLAVTAEQVRAAAAIF